MKLGILTIKNNICLKVCGGPLSVTRGEKKHLSYGAWWTFPSQCVVICTTQRAGINKPIIWSVTATDIEVSFSWPVLVSANISICREYAASPAKTNRT